MPASLSEQGFEHIRKSPLEVSDRILDVQASFRRHQVVAAAACAEFAGQGADSPLELRLDPGVDVLARLSLGPMGIALDASPDCLQAPRQPARFSGLEHTQPAQLLHAGKVDAQVVENEALVQRERFGEFLEERVAAAGEASSPKLHPALRAARFAFRAAFFAAARRSGKPRMLMNPSASFWL